MPKLKKKTLDLIIILTIGGLGGILADQFILPYLATRPPFSKIEFFRQINDGTTIINPTEKIIITENTALEEAIDQISPRLVAIQTYQDKKLISQGTGFIITSDGLIITANDLIPARANQYLIFRNNHSLVAQLIKRDLENNLALLKIEESNLPVVSLVNLEDLRLGQRIILIGLESVKEGTNRFVNLGIIRSISQGKLMIGLSEEKTLANGGPLINVKGEVIGLNVVDQRGLAEVIPANKIKEFIGF